MPNDPLLTRVQALTLLTDLVDYEIAAGLLASEHVTVLRVPRRGQHYRSSEIRAMCDEIRTLVGGGADGKPAE